jgi:hypothetical protein
MVHIQYLLLCKRVGFYFLFTWSVEMTVPCSRLTLNTKQAQCPVLYCMASLGIPTRARYRKAGSHDIGTISSTNTFYLSHTFVLK